MDALSIHLMVNHVPVLSVIVGTLLVILAAVTRRLGLWRLGSAALVVAALSFYPVQWTGGNAEHVDMKRWYVQHDAIEEHEEASEKAIWIVVLAGGVAAYALWLTTRRSASADVAVLSVWLRCSVVAAGLAASAATVKVAYEAGFISHKNPLLDRGVVPPADSVPARPAPST